MTYLCITKQGTYRQVSHLYEHLAIDTLHKILERSNLFPGIDYFLSGQTLENGQIIIEIELYTKQAALIQSTLQTFACDINESALHSTLLQLNAEKQAETLVPDSKKLKDTLEEINERPWQLLANTSPSSVSTSNDLILFTSNHQFTREIRMELSLPFRLQRQNSHLLPLFRLIAKSIVEQVGVSLEQADSLFYDEAIYSGSPRSKHQITAYWRVHRQFSFSKSQLEDYARTTISNVRDLNGYRRYISRIQSINYTKNELMPDVRETGFSAGFVPDHAMWRKIATEKNLNLILDALQINFAKNY